MRPAERIHPGRKGTDLPCNSLISTPSKANFFPKSALSLHVHHSRERGWHAGLINEPCFHVLFGCGTHADSYAQGDITASCMLVIPAGSHSGCLDDPLIRTEKLSHTATFHPQPESLLTTSSAVPLTLLTPVWKSTCAGLERLVVNETNRHLFALHWQVFSLPPLPKLAAFSVSPPLSSH